MSMNEKIGSKRLVVGAGYGLKDWLAQRLSAVVMALYTLGVVLAVVLGGELTYERWVSIIAFEVAVVPLGKMLASMAILSYTYHAWIGIRDLWMDYVKPVGVRLALQVFTILWLVATLVYAAKIVWSI